jgi:hypothetical protein
MMVQRDSKKRTRFVKGKGKGKAKDEDLLMEVVVF